MIAKGSKNYPTYGEIREELRNAADYVGAVIQHEEAVSNALDKDGDPTERDEAERLFLREFKNFIGVVRSAREYLTTAANKSNCDSWLTGRFDAEKHLFEFYRLLVNQSLHQYRPRLEPRTNKIQYVGEPDSVLIPGPGGLIPNKMRVVGLVDPKYFYRLDGLEPDTEKAYELAEKEHAGEGVVLLSLRYLHALEQILKNAERNGRFAKAIAASTSPTP